MIIFIITTIVGGPAKTRSSSMPRGHKVAPRPKVLGDSTLLAMQEATVNASNSSSSSYWDDRSDSLSPKELNASSDSSTANNNSNDCNTHGASTAISSGSMSKEIESRTKNLISPIMELAEDDSYQAHYDRISPKESKSETSRFKEKEQRLYKLATRDTNSRTMQSLLTNDDDVSIASASVGTERTDRSERSIKNKQADKERVKELEAGIFQHLSGKVGGLRHTLNRLDPSQSGVVNFEEFNSAMLQLGIYRTNLFRAYTFFFIVILLFFSKLMCS